MSPSTKTIFFGIQKGGASKSTTSAVTAYILAGMGHRVLAVDLDSQGNLTSLLSGVDDIYEFTGRTVLEAMKNTDSSPEELHRTYVQTVNDHLHFLPSEDFMATFSRWLYRDFERTHRGVNPGLVLRRTLDRLQTVCPYDYIIIDSPPSLGDQTINGMAAATHVVAMFEPSKFCYDALPRFYETVLHVKEQLNPNLRFAGILPTIIDSRRTDAKVLLDALKADEEFGQFLFESRIHRKATTGRLSIQGFQDNPELRRATQEYRAFVEELLSRL